MHNNCQEMFGLPEEREWSRHTRSWVKIERLDSYADHEARIRKQYKYTNPYEYARILERGVV